MTQNTIRLYVIKKNQLLLYLIREESVRKSHFIYAPEVGLTLLDRRNRLIIFISTRYVTRSLRDSIVYTTLSINNNKTKNLYIIISGI